MHAICQVEVEKGSLVHQISISEDKVTYKQPYVAAY
jgi:hypothetical protein